jgi:hypothetical protein
MDARFAAKERGVEFLKGISIAKGKPVKLGGMMRWPKNETGELDSGLKPSQFQRPTHADQTAGKWYRQNIQL